MKSLVVAAVALSVPYATLAEATWQDKALKTVKSEKKVVDARWRMADQNVLWVLMASDGSSRDGFAQYLCMGLAKASKNDALKTVWIYDVANFETGNKAMGTAACK